jgi:hypothetical protein
MAFPSTYSDGDFAILDFDYPLKSTWLDGKSAVRSDTIFNSQEYSRFRNLALKTANALGASYLNSINGLRLNYVPVQVKSSAFAVKISSTENSQLVPRNRIGLNVQFFDTRGNTTVGPIRTFAAPTAALMGSLVKKVDKVALSKAINLHSIYLRVYNDSASPITAGTAVRYDGITFDGIVEIEPTDGNFSDNNFVGIIQEDIPSKETGSCTSAKGPGAWVPNSIISSPNDGGILYLNGDTGGISHTPGGGSQVIGRLLHEGTSGGAHYISFATV